MKRFIEKHGKNIIGVLSGYDRLIFRGGIKGLMYEKGMAAYLNYKRILLKDFKDHALTLTAELKEKTEQYAERKQRPFIYLPGHRKSKEEMAREIANRDRISEGLICIFSVLENCGSYKIVGNKTTQKLEIKYYSTKCLHLYHYWIDPTFGLMHGRIQTWYPFNIQIYLNGREWLGNMMSKTGVSFIKNDNCFTWVSDFNKASIIVEKQLKECWPKTLDSFMKKINPVNQKLFTNVHGYYWTTYQSEWATDIIFKNKKELELIYPELVHHSILTFNSKDIMRFLGKRINKTGEIPANFNGELISNLKQRTEGVRIKHSINANSVKIYDKAGSVLRIETTINRPNEFKVYRPVCETEEMKWQSMRKSVIDILRRAQISQSVNERHLDALADARVEDNFATFLSTFLFPVYKDKKRTRGLEPLNKDKILLDTIAEGKFTINGFRNCNVREIMFPKLKTKEEIKKHSAKISRLLRILRTHGVIKKVPRTNRYLLTKKGTKLVSALKTINESKVCDMLKLSA